MDLLIFLVPVLTAALYASAGASAGVQSLKALLTSTTVACSATSVIFAACLLPSQRESRTVTILVILLGLSLITAICSTYSFILLLKEEVKVN